MATKDAPVPNPMLDPMLDPITGEQRVLAPGHTFKSVTEKISGIVLTTHTPLGWLAGFMMAGGMAGVLLVAVNATTARLIPLYAIGVFIGFTISQTGMVRHWHGQRSPRWWLRAALNGTGALLTATATAVFIISKFTTGAWVVVLTVPALMLLFSRIQSYYQAVGLELELSQLPHRPRSAKSLVIVPISSISKLTEYALNAALSLGDEVIAVSVHPEAADSAAFRAEWDRWNPGVRLDTLDSPHRSLVHPVVDYVRQAQQAGRQVAVLILEIQPRRWRYRILQNQRGLLLATVLRASTDVVICTIPYRLTTR